MLHASRGLIGSLGQAAARVPHAPQALLGEIAAAVERERAMVADAGALFVQCALGIVDRGSRWQQRPMLAQCFQAALHGCEWHM